MTGTKRWLATVFYRADAGLIDVCHDIEEIEDLHDIIERGPDWNCIERIEIVLLRNTTPGLTVEQSREL